MAGGEGEAAMAKAREHIEEMRRVRYSIGGDANQLSEDLHQAVKYLSAELYAKDVHFLMELIQNAEDNKYPEGMAPSLEFVVTSEDITATGAPSTLLVFNNEIGFSKKDIDSICRVGGSTKKGKRQLGYIGEKGIGFKSVFLVTSRPYIFSNGYQIRFSEEPLPECNLGYIVPEWVKQPSLSDISRIYRSSTVPTTTLVLPLKAGKVEAVKHQLSNVHPEVLLFLNKIKRLSVREDNPDPRLSTVSAISITSETDYEERKNMNAVSYTIHLSAEENYEGVEKECSYYMWRQKFAVNPECRDQERRMEVENWVITLALPCGERLDRGTTSPGIYAYLPTEMVTNFPFIIQADFILASSRETILLDRKWNTGILNCVPTAFVEALCALVTPSEYCPVSSLARILDFLPVEKPAYKELEVVRDAIQAKLAGKRILPAESDSSQVFFYRPKEVARLIPGFWKILFQARKQGVTLHNLSSHGVYILHSTFDVKKYDKVLEFLGVQHVSSQWYGKCVSASDLVMGVSEDVYIELLHFFARNWDRFFVSAGVDSVPLLKFVGDGRRLSLWSINRASQYSARICLSTESEQISWLIDWNIEFKGVTERYFMPKSTQECLGSSANGGTVRDWLRKHASIQPLSVNDLCCILLRVITDTRLLVAFTHFLFHSKSKKYLSESEVRLICDSMPVVDAHGRINSSRVGLLVPGKGSKWVSLLGSNPWTGERYIELAQDYESGNHFASVYTGENQLMSFLKSYAGAADIPDLCPPDASFSSIDSPLTKTNAFLLLDWIQNLSIRRRLPAKFLSCIKEGNWLKTSVGYKAPEQSFLSSSSWGDLLQVGSELVDIPLIDQRFYDNKIASYEDELKKIGVMFESAEACQFIGKELMSRASSSNLPRSSVITMLMFIRFLRQKYLSPEEFVESLKNHGWLKTSHGYRSPVGSILLDPSWEAALPVSNLPVIDESFYGDCISTFKDELELMGVVVKFDRSIVADNFLFPAYRGLSLGRPTIYLILDCIRESLLSCQAMNELKSCSWIRTTAGIKAPSDCFLSNPKWECMLKVIAGLPLIDEKFYGASIHSYERELEKIGVLVSFSKASVAVAAGFKQLVSSSSMTRFAALSLLFCFKHLMESRHELPESLLECVRSEKWVRTRLGLQKPNNSILYGDEWAAISPISRLPFIDESENGYGNVIRTFEKQLEIFGVVVGMKAGSMLVAVCLHIPPSPSELKPANLTTLLKCLRNLREEDMQLPKDFMEKVNKKWVKTMLGYVSPRESLLFIPDFAGKLHPEDGPFIDDSFYGSEIKSFDQELGTIGVSSTEANVCSLVAGNLTSHTDLAVITRIYTHLSKCGWQPASNKKRASWVWIPNGRDGQWVSPQACVLHDHDNLFGSKLRVLDKHYDQSLLGFFFFAFEVRPNPDVEDYCKLWSEWEGRDEPLSMSECRSFWVSVGKHWGIKKNEKLLSERLVKLPASVSLGEVQLVNKKDVFIPDDLQLQHLFDKNGASAIFVWQPQPSLPSLSRSKLNEIYKSIGVQTISETVVKGQVLVPTVDQLTVINPAEVLVRDGLLKIVLGFLSDPSLDMSMEKRHKVAKHLCNVHILETKEPIKVSYSLKLSSGESICVAASRMIRWEREDSRLYLQKLDSGSPTRRGRIEFATHFSEAISEGLLWESPDQIADLAGLVKLGCLLEFEEDAVEFLLKTRNLQIFMEDEEFISSAMSSK